MSFFSSNVFQEGKNPTLLGQENHIKTYQFKQLRPLFIYFIALFTYRSIFLTVNCSIYADFMCDLQKRLFQTTWNINLPHCFLGKNNIQSHNNSNSVISIDTSEKYSSR